MSDIAEKIRKLLAKADSSTHPEEADAFMVKAHTLMREHGLHLQDIGKLGEDPVGIDKDGLRTSSSYPWLTRVASALAALYGCKFVYFKVRNEIKYDIVGRESARGTFQLMMPFVERQIKALAREAFNEGHYNSRMQAVSRVGNATALRIWAMVRQAPKAEGTGVNALVPVDIIQAAMDEAYPKVKKARAVALTVDHVAKNKASRVSVNVQAGSNTAATKRLTA